MAAVIRVTRVVPAAPGRAHTFVPTLVPVARIDTCEVGEIGEYLENEFAPTLDVTRIRKVNGEYIDVIETLGTVESLIAHAGEK